MNKIKTLITSEDVIQEYNFFINKKYVTYEINSLEAHSKKLFARITNELDSVFLGQDIEPTIDDYLAMFTLTNNELSAIIEMNLYTIHLNQYKNAALLLNLQANVFDLALEREIIKLNLK